MNSFWLLLCILIGLLHSAFKDKHKNNNSDEDKTPYINYWWFP